MKSKGFTLIELLAVMVILAIITLIAVPVVATIINNAKKNAFKDSIYGIIKAGELYYTHNSSNDDVLEKEFVLEFPNDTELLEVKGTIPNGIMGLKSSGEVAIGFMNKRFCATKEYNEKEITITEDRKNCKMPKVSYINGIMTSSNKCIKKGNYCSQTEILSEEGVKVNVEVAPTIFYDFYVIDDEDNKLTLIMDRNLFEKVLWISKEDFEKTGGTYGVYALTKGPLTLLNELEEKTYGWTNILNSDYIISDDGWSILYEDIKINSKARALTYAEANTLKIANNGVLPKCLYDNLSTDAYWLSSTKDGTIDQVVIIKGDGSISGSGISNIYKGLRPVITISK